MRYDTFAAAVVNDHAAFVSGLNGRYLAAVAPGADKSPRQKIKLIQDGMRAALVFLQQAELRAHDFTDDVTAGRFVDTVEARKGAFIAALRLLATENVREVAKRYAAGNLNLGSVLQGGAGALGGILQQRLAGDNLLATDSSGRRWKSPMLVKTMARDFAYQSTIDVQAIDLAATEDLASVVYPNVEHPGFGLVVSFSGKGAGEPFERVRDTIFHVNSSAELRHVSS